MTKFLLTTLAFLVSAPLGFSQAKENTKTPRVLIMTDDDSFGAWIVTADRRKLRYTETENSTSYEDKLISAVNVYFLEPGAFSEAMALYRSRSYKEAHAQFGMCKDLYKKFQTVPGNYSTLAAFYQMECTRKQEDLAILDAEMEVFLADQLLHRSQKIQLEINSVFWDAVRTKAWNRIVSIGQDPKWSERKLSGGQRAQVSYCMALAYEGTKQPTKALNSYNGAFVADFSASEVITRKSALSCLRILKSHEDVLLAMKLFGTEEYSENSNGAFLIREGIALVKLWDKSLGGGAKLPDEYKIFLKYDKK